MSRINVRAIIYHDGKFLLAKNYGAGDFWYLPGGGVEEGESLLEAIDRELIEETGVKPDIGKLLYIHQITHNDKTTPPAFFFHIKNGYDYINVKPDDTEHGKRELDDLRYIDVRNETVLPGFLTNELPELVKQNFQANTQLKITFFEEVK